MSSFNFLGQSVQALSISSPINKSTYNFKTRVHEGNGFLSLMARVSFLTEASEEFNLIIKLVPDNESMDGARDLCLHDKLDQVEIKAYLIYASDMIQVFPEIKKNICEHYYAKIQPENIELKIPYSSVIILKDLKPQGYGVKNFYEGIPSKRYNEVLDFMIQLHVSSKCIEEKHPGKTLRDIYPWLSNWFLPISLGGSVPQVSTFFENGFKLAIEAIQKHSSKPEISKIYQKVGEKSKEIYQKILEVGQKNACAIHGDLWTYNILIPENDDSPLKIIDWQFFGYADPGFDLSIFTMSLLHPDELTPAKVHETLKYYYNQVKNLSKSKGLLNYPDRSFEEFEHCFNMYGLGYVMMVFIPGFEVMGQLPNAMEKVMKILELLVEVGAPQFLLKQVE